MFMDDKYALYWSSCTWLTKFFLQTCKTIFNWMISVIKRVFCAFQGYLWITRDTRGVWWTLVHSKAFPKCIICQWINIDIWGSTRWLNMNLSCMRWQYWRYRTRFCGVTHCHSKNNKFSRSSLPVILLTSGFASLSFNWQCVIKTK